MADGEGNKPDGTDRLCRAVYGRPAEPKDYLGGSEAAMLHDAADLLFLCSGALSTVQQHITEAGNQVRMLREATGSTAP